MFDNSTTECGMRQNIQFAMIRVKREAFEKLRKFFFPEYIDTVRPYDIRKCSGIQFFL